MKTASQKPNARRGGFPALLRRLILAWLGASVLEFALVGSQVRSLEGLETLASMSLARLLVVTGILLALLEGLSWGRDRKMLERWALVGVFALVSVLALTASYTPAFLVVCLGVLGVLGVYARLGWRSGPEPEPAPSPAPRIWVILTALAALAFFALVSAWTVGRVLSFSTPSYDFGIFSQMFHSMKTTLSPVTTLERDGPLSHFAVHVSPIYYLLLPFYALVPKPETLQVLQAAVLASAVIPLWKLGKHHGFSGPGRLLLCLMLLLLPSYAGGASYDIHENAFLTPLLLWLFYGLDRKSTGITAAAALLTLTVKEDAAVYVAVIALYLLLRSALQKDQRGLWVGAALLAVSIGWFLGVTGYLSAKGDGVMTYRYKNFMYDGSGSLTSVIKAVLLCPMKAVYECVDPEKLEFIALTLLPLAGLPLLTRRYERYLLLIPFVLVNLMSDYQYQHDIFFQYTYGSTGCLMYLALVNLKDLKLQRSRLLALGLAACVGLGCFSWKILPTALHYPKQCAEYAGYYASLREVLDRVPEEASVAATTYYTTHLSQRDTLYDIKYASMDHILECEYIVLGVKSTTSYKPYAQDGKNGYENFLAIILDAGYEKVDEVEGRLEVYRRT